MRVKHILVAVDDSPDSLAAARLAVELAGALSSELRAVHVLTNHLLDVALEEASGRPAVDVRRALAARTVLARVRRIAEAARVQIDTDLLSGDVGPAILDAARRWPADLLIVGKSARSASGEPYVGAQTRHVLEFASQPVLVVAP